MDPIVLERYADLIIRVGLNLQKGQRLLVLGPIANGGVALDAAPLVRAVVKRAYEAGAPIVEVLWGDEALALQRVQCAPAESFEQFSAWLPSALLQHVEAGHATLSIYANDPDLLQSAPPGRVSAIQAATAHAVRPFRERISRNATNWLVAAAPAASWAARVFPGLPPAEQVARLGRAIEHLCRLDAPDPIAAWKAHLDGLAERTALLNARRYEALHYRGPGTDLTVGLVSKHIWTGGRSTSANGIAFAANLPTEEVFTMPSRDRVDGHVRSSKPLSYGGTLIEDFTFTFEAGRIVNVQAARGEAVLRQLIATDPGAARLGELALVPHSSPVSQMGHLFFNTLFDENAASHLAIGAAYAFTMEGGEALTPDEFERRGGNRSATHVDFMIGSGELDVDGVLPGGGTEPIMRSGEWATPLSDVPHPSTAS
jgi:aminopeptidase